MMQSADYRSILASVVKAERFEPDNGVIFHLLVHVGLVTGLGVTVALHIDAWPWPIPILLALVAGHSVCVLGFATHELTHGASRIKRRAVRRGLEWLGYAYVLFAVPTIQRRAHNHLHHRRTNTPVDPDRRLWVEEVQAFAAASIAPWLFPNKSHPWLTCAWGFTLSVLSYHNSLFWHTVLRTRQLYDVGLNARLRRAAVVEATLNASVYFALFALSGFSALMAVYLAAQYYVGSSIAGAYIATNHLLCGLSDDERDPLANTVTLVVPRWVDFIHLNFSHHVEHHLYPGLNHKALPVIKRALQELFPERYKQMRPRKAIAALLGSPVAMQDHNTLANCDGTDPQPIMYPVSQVGS